MASYAQVFERGGRAAFGRAVAREMESTRPYRPRVSRETRLLLLTALAALAALWVLARIRFPDLPPTSSAVQPLLTPLVMPKSLDGVAADIAEVQARVAGTLLSLDSDDLITDREFKDRSVAAPVVAMRVTDSLAVAWVPPAPFEVFNTDRVLASDQASGLVVVRTAEAAPAPTFQPWVPRRLDHPRYLLMTDALAGRVSLRPVFVSSLEAVASPLWPTPLWRVPDGAGVQPGAFAFTTTGEFAGVAIVHAGRRFLVPPPVMFGEIDRLIETAPATAGDIGVAVQALTPDLATATGASAGVVVSAADASGPVGQHLKVADVIVALNGQPVTSVDEWQIRTNRLVVSEPMALRVLRAGAWLDLDLRAPSRTKEVRKVNLGLRLRHVAGTGAEVLAVEPGSAGTRAGLVPGDFITLVGTTSAPTPAQVQSAFDRTPEGLPLVLAYTRGRLSVVTTLAR